MTGSGEYIVVFVTTSSADKASEIAKSLVEERLAACGNIVESIRSIYRWQGEVADEREALLILKTRRDLFEKLRDRVLKLHDYDVPEIVAINIEAGNQAYLRWLEAGTAGAE